MTKPEPIAEIAIQTAENPLWIHVGTPDAESWLLDNAGEFGQLRRSANDAFWVLSVSPLYDIKEVRDHLLSMGEDPTAPRGQRRRRGGHRRVA